MADLLGHQTSNSSPYVISTNSDSSPYYMVWHAFRGGGDPWKSTVPDAYAKVDFGMGAVVNHYRAAVAGTPEDVTGFVLEGSNNDSTWTTLDTRSVGGYGDYSYDISNTVAYRYYRISFTGADRSGHFSINTIELHGVLIRTSPFPTFHRV